MLRISRTLCTCLMKKQNQVFKINELPKASLKTSSSLNVREIKPQGNLPGKDWSILYSLPNIKLFYIFSRLKILVPGVIVGVSVPASLVLEYMKYFPPGSGAAIFIIGILNAAGISLLSLPLKDVVGLIHIKNDQSKIMISSFDFWGKPRKVIISPENIRMIKPKYSVEKKVYTKFQLDDESAPVKIVKGHALITDHRTFTNIFGYGITKDEKK